MFLQRHELSLFERNCPSLFSSVGRKCFFEATSGEVEAFLCWNCGVSTLCFLEFLGNTKFASLSGCLARPTCTALR